MHDRFFCRVSGNSAEAGMDLSQRSSREAEDQLYAEIDDTQLAGATTTSPGNDLAPAPAGNYSFTLCAAYGVN